MLIDESRRTHEIAARLSALLASGLSLERAVAELCAQRCGDLHLRAALVSAFGLPGREAARLIARQRTSRPPPPAEKTS